MTRDEAVVWVHSHDDSDQLDRDELREAFHAVFGCTPDPERYDDEDTLGQWSLLCAAVRD